MVRLELTMILLGSLQNCCNSHYATPALKKIQDNIVFTNYFPINIIILSHGNINYWCNW